MADKKNKTGAVAVLGAGIAGMQAALDLSEMGFKVHLIEKHPCIGGIMSQLDKTFPTNDCAMCIMSPKLVDVGRCPNVELVTGADVKRIEGEAGNFTLSLTKRPRYIDENLCNGCGDCAEKCPVVLPSEHDEGMGDRKAVYRRYPQAIPNLFSIDKTGTPPCRDACPAHVNVQGYAALISIGEYRKAYDLIREQHPLPSVCGRICHHPCETACNRTDVDEPVAINYLKRFVADYVAGNGGPGKDAAESSETPERSEKVAVVGAGPAGLTAAWDLARKGFKVTVYEREAKPGGALYTAVPAYRLNRDVLFREAESILNHKNIEVLYGVTVGRDKTLGRIKDEGHAAVFVAAGAPRSRKLDIEGADAKGVFHGVEFLHRVNTVGDVRLEGTVTVVGGGNVATDVARTARRLGAEKVNIVCLESRDEMPAYGWEVAESLEEGVEIHNGWSPDRIENKDGRVASLHCVRCTGVFDADGRFRPQTDRDEKAVFDSDTVIMAIGQSGERLAFEGIEGMEFRPGDLATGDPVTLQTGIEWLFVGGDGAAGPASAVDAVAAGHAAAESIERLLDGKNLHENRAWSPASVASLPNRPFPKRPRQPMPTRDPKERVKDFSEIELGFSEEAAREESQRCLNCGGCSECMVCVETCGRDAIRHMMQPEEIQLSVGAVILATGCEKYDPSTQHEYGYGRCTNVITSVEFERILSASGPSEGRLTRPSDESEPKKIAWVQCVGSRQTRESGNEYCSSVCCMYSIKEAVIAKEHGHGVDCHIYTMDVRTFGKDFEAYYERAKNEYDVSFRRARVSLVEEVPGSDDLTLKYVDERNRVQTETYDMVVLSAGLVPAPSNENVAACFGVGLEKFGFVAADPFFRERTGVEGIYVCGTASGPRDIPETVATASAATASASSLLKEARNTLVAAKELPPETDVSEEDARVGVFVCRCGINIGAVVNVPEVVEFAKTLPGVAYAEENLYTCSQDTQERIKAVVQEHGINRVVVASCTPRTHETLFQDTLREVGLNSFLFEFVGIREQCSWVHSREPAAATDKAKELVAMGAARARLLQPYVRTMFSVCHRGLVIGGGASGLTAALSLAEQGFEVFLVEREKELGGNLRHVVRTIEGQDVQELLRSLTERVAGHPAITTYTDSEVADSTGYVGNYRTTIRNLSSGENAEVEHGVVIIAVGAQLSETDEYGTAPTIVTQREFERRLAEGESFERVAMIQCAGSREPGQPWCSRVCCQTAIKNALTLIEANKDAQVTIFFRDIRAYGLTETYYRQTRESGVVFVRYEPDEKPRVVLGEDEKPTVRYRNLLLDRETAVEADVLVLSTGMEPRDNRALTTLYKLPTNADGFFLEAHAKLRPLDFPVDGIFLCGAAHAPKTIAECITQANGAAARAATLLGKDEIQAGGNTVQVKERICSGCGLCVAACPYEAREIVDGKARIIEVLCQGCGACATACPNGATWQTGFTKSQVYRMVEAAV